MPSTPWIPVVKTIKNKTAVSAEVVNPVLEQLLTREQHLYEKFAELTNKSTLVSFGVPIATGQNLVNGNAVYFDVTGLKLAEIGYINNTLTTAYFTPTNSSFVYGVIKTTYDDPANAGAYLADVYMSGKVTLDVSLSTLLDETFEVGPLYLSKFNPGRYSKTPEALAVYVGYATSETEIILAPKVNELSKLLTQYGVTVLDRVAGEPTLLVTTWTIENPNINNVGWVPVSGVAGTDYPTGAKFRYNIPESLKLDYEADAASGLTSAEGLEAQTLLLNFAPTPVEYNALYVNGVLQIQATGSYAADAVYLVNEQGIWWMKDQNGLQPWASNILDTTGGYTSASDWDDYIATPSIVPNRKKMFLSFAKANPDLKTLTVTSLRADTTTYPSVAFTDYTNGAPANSGDVVLKLLLPTSNNATTATGTALSGWQYNTTTGRVDLGVTSVVSSVVGLGGVTVTNLPNGVVGVSTTGLAGQVLSLEPAGGTTLEYLGLNSFLRFKHNLAHRVIGKFQLPNTIPATDLELQLYLIGESTIGAGATSIWTFEYNANVPASLLPSGSGVSTVLNGTIPAPVTVTMTFPPTAANTAFVSPATITIPAASVCANALVNFRLTRTTGTYSGSIGVLGVFWKFAVS